MTSNAFKSKYLLKKSKICFSCQKLVYLRQMARVKYEASRYVKIAEKQHRTAEYSPTDVQNGYQLINDKMNSLQVSYE